MTTYDPSIIRSVVISAEGTFSFQRLTSAVRSMITGHDERKERDAAMYFLPNDPTQESWRAAAAGWVATQKEFLDLYGITAVHIFPLGVDVESAKAQLTSAIAQRRVLVIATGPDYKAYMPAGFDLDGHRLVHPDTNFRVDFLQPVSE